MSKERKSDLKIYGIYTLLFAAIIFFLVFQLVIFGISLIWEVDGYLQWYPIYEKTRSTLSTFLNTGSFSFWHWDIGLGSDYLSNFSFVLFDPVSYIALLFPTKYIDVAYTLIIIIKLYLAGIAMMFVLRKLEKGNYLCLIGAISYAVCGFGIISMRHSFFVTELVVFPIIILGIIKVWKKESPIVLILGVAWQLLLSVYFSYMTAIFAVVYIIAKYFVEREEKSVKDFLILMFKYVGYVLIALMIAAPVVAVSVYALMNTSKDSANVLKFLPDIKQIGKFFVSFVADVDVNNNYAVIATNGLIALTVPVMLAVKKKTTHVVMVYFSIVCLFFPYLQSVLNGFSYAVGRWCYCMTFFLVVAGVEMIEELQANGEKYKKAFIICGGFCLLSAFVTKGIFATMTNNSFVIMFVNLLSAVICFDILTGKCAQDKKKKYVVAVVSINIITVLFTTFNPFFDNAISIYNEIGKSYSGYNSSSLKYANKIDDDGFYRVNTDWNPYAGGNNNPVGHTALNTSIFHQVPSTSEYLSTVNAGWIEYNLENGNVGGNFRRMTSLSNDNRSRLDYLEGVKYYIGADESQRGTWNFDYDSYPDSYFEKCDDYNLGAHIYKSEYDTGLGYVFENAVSKETYDSEDMVKKEQLLMNAVVMDEDDIEKAELKPLNMSEVDYSDYTNITYKIKDNDPDVELKDNGFKVLESSGKLEIKLDEAVKDAEIYVVFKGLKKQTYSLSEYAKVREKCGYVDTRVDRYIRKINKIGRTDYGDFSLSLCRSTGNGNVKKEILNKDGENQGIAGVEDYVLNLGYAKDSVDSIKMNIETIGKYTYDSINVYKVGKEAFAERASVLSDNVLHTTKVGNDVIEGYVDSQYDGLLYLSILRNAGFDIYIDGEKQKDIYDVNTAFTGVKVSKGHHDVKIVYHIIGYPYINYISILGVVLAIAVSVLLVKMKRKKNVVKKEADKKEVTE